MIQKLHVLLDSREQSVSFARDFYLKSGVLLGFVEHFRVKDFSARLAACLKRLGENDLLLVAAHYFSAEELENARLFLRPGKANDNIVLASYNCLSHIRVWCDEVGCKFTVNTFKSRKYDTPAAVKGPCIGRPKDIEERRCGIKDIDRLWVQYRLMISIISRSSSLSEVCRQLISGEPSYGDRLEDEYNRAVRYFRLGEPDMAGGTYVKEKDNSANPVDEMRMKINKIAASDFNVIIRGESGSGKEVVAWSIHELSSRRDKPYIALNCAGIPDELLESELFGYTKGSHNLAYEESPGLLGAAAGGTLFLDELPDMSPRIQSKLLRFLEGGEYRPLGGLENKYADVRVIAAGQPERIDSKDNVRVDLKNRIGQLDVSIMSLREMERKSPGTISKIAYILLERMTWTTVYREGHVYELCPRDIKTYQEKLALPRNALLISTLLWNESNSRELNNFLRKWIVLGDDELLYLDQCNQTLTEGVQYCKPIFYDDALNLYFSTPNNREDLKKLLSKKPFHNLKRSYVRHLFEIYSKMVEKENAASDSPNRPTQKELAKLMGVTENTICRYLN